MRIYYRQNEVPNFYIEFRERRDDDDEQPFHVPGLENPASSDKIIRRKQEIVGYKIGGTTDHIKFITDNIVNWIQLYGRWHGADKNDLEAIKLLKEWCVWLVTIETAVIAALAVFGKGVVLGSKLEYCLGRMLAVLIILTLAWSIFWAINLILALPAISQTLPPTEPGKDIFSITSTGWLHKKLSWYVKMVRWSSFAGFVCFVFLALGIVLLEKMPTSG